MDMHIIWVVLITFFVSYFIGYATGVWEERRRRRLYTKDGHYIPKEERE